MQEDRNKPALTGKKEESITQCGGGLITYFPGRARLLLTSGSAGTVLIEIVIGVAVFVTIFVGILSSLQLLLKAQTEHKGKIGGMALMNDGLEKARSLSYANLGVVGGNPSGVLPVTEQITLNATTYTRAFAVYNIDDAHDGTGAGDTNGKPNDYKKVKVTVTWNIKGAARSIVGTSLVTPDGLEP
jgi:hypothetical protein